MREILGKISGDPQESLASSIMKENHRSVAKLFVDSMHPFDLRYQSKVLGAFDLFYFFQFGLLHCIYAAKKQSIFDKVWSDIIQRVLLPLETRSSDNLSALGLFPNVDDPPFLMYSRLFIFRESEGKDLFLFSHCLVWLDIIHDDDVARLRRMDLRTAPSDTGTPGGMLRHFAEQTMMQSTGGKANALHIACLRRNAAAVKMVLESTYHLFGKEACIDLLSQELNHSKHWRETPFAFAVVKHSLVPTNKLAIVMETLLLFESQFLNTAGDKEKAHSSQESHRAQQWSHVCGTDTIALTHALRFFEEDDLCHLLQIAGPITIDKPDKSGYTSLMTAARMGRLKIMRILVEDYHADLNVRGLSGESALDVAREENEQAVADYLEKRMGISKPE